MDTETQVWIQDEVVCSLHKTNTIKKGMNVTILLQAIAK